MRAIVFGVLISSPLFGFSEKDFKEILSTDDLKALTQILVSTMASCTDKIITNPSDLSLATRELTEVALGIGEVITESLITLALKKDYPNACHVLPKEFLNDIEATTSTRKKCIWPTRFGCALHEMREFPKYTYYWPKYFIEVSQKGNDPHPSFAAGNKLYSANRKIADEISRFADLKGPYGLVAKVIAASKGIKTATSSVTGQGFDFGVSKEEMDQAAQGIVLTPFEKLRIRANSNPDMTSYEVNIWPVGLSTTIAKHLTVCGKGGFAWKLEGVPMTCPIAMSRDAWSYWDSGMLDYLNPNAIRGIAAATNPVACISDNLASVQFDNDGAKLFSGTTESNSSKDIKEGALSNLPNSYRGLGMCSFPILGDAEAIASQTLGLKDSFKGPWCTVWGPIVPRMSTHVYSSDYGFPNAALKFKLLAHDLFGIPRGEKERWALAYPWENEASDSLLDFLGPMGDFLESLGVKKISKEYMRMPGMGRSSFLMPPGDPRLIDSFNTSDLINDAKNLTREIIYAAGMDKAASEAEKQALKAFAHKNNQDVLTSDQILTIQRSETKQTTDETARLKGEPIFEKRIYCHVRGEKQGHFTRQDVNFDVQGFGTIAFERVHDINQCHHGRDGKCLSRHKLTGRCLRPESIFYVSLEKWEIVRYQRIQNPKQYVVNSRPCKYSEGRNANTHSKHSRCGEDLRLVGQDDTRRNAHLPDHSDPTKTVGQDHDGAKNAGLAARVGTWVAAELARARYEEISGKSLLPGKKRVYTVYESITCEPKTEDGRDIFRKQVPGGWIWSSCQDAVRLEVRKYFQQKLLRRTCDKILNYKLGEPFK